MDHFNIKGKVVLITGSTQGIGFGLAKGFLNAHCHVYLNGRNQEKVDAAVDNLRGLGDQIQGVAFDVAVEDQVQGAIEQIYREQGKLDVLVNNAGIIRRNSLEDLSLEDWEAVIDTDLKGPFMAAKCAAQIMKKQNGGKIINICSLMSEIGRDTVGAYAAAKGGLKMLTKSMAVDWARFNIQANGIGPGYISTPINEEYRQQGNPLNDYIISRTPAQRWGTPEDLVGTALFLASAASDFINGQIIYVDGGLLASFGNPFSKNG